MIEKLIKAILEKHGPVTINKVTNNAHGDFEISTVSQNKNVLYTYCFSLVTGLINHLKKDAI